jgi:hypothetical protein
MPRTKQLIPMPGDRVHMPEGVFPADDGVVFKQVRVGGRRVSNVRVRWDTVQEDSHYSEEAWEAMYVTERAPRR